MPRPRYEQMHDGEWYELGKSHDFACCDCGLVHTEQFRIRDGKIQIKINRNPKATGGRRKAMKESPDGR